VRGDYLCLGVAVVGMLLQGSACHEATRAAPERPGVTISVEDTYSAGDRIFYDLELVFGNRARFFYPCVDDVVVWETLLRNHKPLKSQPFQSDVGLSRRGIQSRPCAASPISIRNLHRVVFRIPLNYYMRQLPSTRIYEMPAGEYSLQITYMPGLALAMEHGADDATLPPRWSLGSVFGVRERWRSNVVRFRVVPRKPSSSVFPVSSAKNGSSRKCGGRFMDEGESEFEVLHVPEAAGLTFKDLDLVVHAFERAGGDGVIVPGEEAKAVGAKGFGEAGHEFEAGSEGTGDPGSEETASSLSGRHGPETAEVFFEEVGLEERLVETLEPLEVRDCGVVEPIAALEEQEASSLECAPGGSREATGQLPAGRVDGSIGEGHDVEGIVNDGDIREDIADGQEVGGPHVDGHRLERTPAVLESSKKGDDRVGASALGGVKDRSGIEVEDDGHELMAFSDREFIDRDTVDESKRSLLESTTQVILENVLDQSPADPEMIGDMLDWSDPAQIDNVPLERSKMTLLAFRKEDRFSKPPATPATLLLMPVKHNDLPPGPDRQGPELSDEPPLERKVPGWRPTSSASPLTAGQLDVMQDDSALILRAQVTVPPQTQCVVNKARRRHDWPPSSRFSTIEDRLSGGDSSTPSTSHPAFCEMSQFLRYLEWVEVAQDRKLQQRNAEFLAARWSRIVRLLAYQREQSETLDKSRLRR